MSNHLAFATVTATLQSLLQAAVKDLVSGAQAQASAERLDAEVLKNAVGVNVFLYQVTPNVAWRNADLPSRRSDGTTAQRPQAAFDLHYLLSFHGKEKDYEPQRLLGAVVRVLHSQPVLSRQMIRDVSTGDLSGSNLADQVELVRFSPLGFSLEELSKLWSVFFQVPYKLSLAYQASVVLVDADFDPGPALPVLERHLDVVPDSGPQPAATPPASRPSVRIKDGKPVVEISQPATAPPVEKGLRTVTVGIEPPVSQNQRVVLLLNLLGDPDPPTDPRSFSADAELRTSDVDVDSVQFKLRGLKAGQELLVRVQVDGVDSLLGLESGVYATPKVTVP